MKQQMDDASQALKDWSADAKEKVSDIKDRAGDKIETARAKGKVYVAQNPEKSMLAAAGVGVAVGALIALLFSRDRD